MKKAYILILVALISGCCSVIPSLPWCEDPPSPYTHPLGSELEFVSDFSWSPDTDAKRGEVKNTNGVNIKLKKSINDEFWGYYHFSEGLEISLTTKDLDDGHFDDDCRSTSYRLDYANVNAWNFNELGEWVIVKSKNMSLSPSGRIKLDSRVHDKVCSRRKSEINQHRNDIYTQQREKHNMDFVSVSTVLKKINPEYIIQPWDGVEMPDSP